MSFALSLKFCSVNIFHTSRHWLLRFTCRPVQSWMGCHMHTYTFTTILLTKQFPNAYSNLLSFPSCIALSSSSPAYLVLVYPTSWGFLITPHILISFKLPQISHSSLIPTLVKILVYFPGGHPSQNCYGRSTLNLTTLMHLGTLRPI